MFEPKPFNEEKFWFLQSKADQDTSKEKSIENKMRISEQVGRLLPETILLIS